MEVECRHEWKHEINAADRSMIRSRLQAVAQPDPHAAGGKYLIRSLYFDDMDNSALREKIDGVNMREKFRIRYYNGDTSLIHLEKKCRINGLCSKFSTPLTRDEAQAITEGLTGWMEDCDRPLLQELYVKMRNRGLEPKTIVDYTRESYVFGPGNGRVTIDYDIRTGLQETDFLNPGCVTILAGESPIILEVKWDETLPDAIRQAVDMKGFSGRGIFQACRFFAFRLCHPMHLLVFQPISGRICGLYCG